MVTIEFSGEMLIPALIIMILSLALLFLIGSVSLIVTIRRKAISKPVEVKKDKPETETKLVKKVVPKKKKKPLPLWDRIRGYQ